MDKIKKDGSVLKDRAKANVYLDLYVGNYKDFSFDKNEVTGIVKVNAKDALDLFKKENGKIKATILTEDDNGNIIETKRNVDFKEFLVNEHETAIDKYESIVNKVIELTK